MNLTEVLKSTKLEKEEIEFLFKILEAELKYSLEAENKLDKTFKLITVLEKTFDQGEDYSISGDLDKAKEEYERFKLETIAIKVLLNKLQPLKELIE